MPDTSAMLEFSKIALPAFIGAGFAFLLNALRDWWSLQRSQLANGIEAQFLLINHWETLENLRRQALDRNGVRENPNRHLLLHPMDYHPRTETIEISRLGFMLRRNYADLLHRMMIAEAQFITAIRTLERRNKFHDEMQKGAESHNNIGPRIDSILKDQTDGLYQTVDDGLELYKLLIPEFREYLRKRFCFRLWPWGLRPLKFEVIE